MSQGSTPALPAYLSAVATGVAAGLGNGLIGAALVRLVVRLLRIGPTHQTTGDGQRRLVRHDTRAVSAPPYTFRAAPGD
jgi:hypothetical protein